MHNNKDEIEEKEFKLRKEAISKYWLLACFSFDNILDHFENVDEIYENTYFLEKSRLYKMKDNNKYYSFTHLFMIIATKLKKENKDVYIEPILDKIIQMNKDKVISQRMTFIKMKDEFYRDILEDYVSKNNVDKYKITSQYPLQLSNIISKDDKFLKMIMYKNKYKQVKMKDFINYYLQENMD